MASYCASKAAIDMLSKTIAVEEGPKVKGCHQVVVVVAPDSFPCSGHPQQHGLARRHRHPAAGQQPRGIARLQEVGGDVFFWEERGPI